MRTRSIVGLGSVLLVSLGLGACGDDESPGEDVSLDVSEDVADAESDASDAGADVEDVSADTGDVDASVEDTAADVPLDGSGDASEDVDTTPPPEPLTFDYNWPIFEAPTDPLADSELESCSLFQATDCSGGESTERVCDIYDVDAGEFVAEPDAMTLRAYLYDRWYELHMSPSGQTADRVFTEVIPPGTPEEEWADPELFSRWAGAGDSAIWTGTALNAYILRYLATGTEADYLRMEEKARVMVNFFEVTQIPGYLARYHYLGSETNIPRTPDYISETINPNPDHRPIENPESLDVLPDAYFENEGTPYWSGDPSIDQYGGAMVAFPMVYGLLRDEALKERIEFHMLCYLHSLRRIEITNLQQNDDALGAFNDLFGGGDALNLDPGDFDFESLDTIVLYVHPQINVANEDTYPRECGDFIQMEPWREIDASSNLFIPEVLKLVRDINRDNNGADHINHFYIPSIRGGDAMHMMHLTLMAYAFTEDERYADFLRDELLTNIDTAAVAATMSALILPKYCRRFYGTNITATPLWAFNNLLADSELDVWMQNVTVDEMWEKETATIGNVNTNLMFAGSVSPEIGGEAREEALAYALEELPRFGGNGGILEDPRRTYNVPYDEAVAALPEGITPQCATEAERATCERPTVIFGATIEGENISFECTGASSECVMEDGLCTTAEASHPLPGPQRRWGDYGWQRSPFGIGESAQGVKQSPGTDYAEQFWMARFYEFLEGNQQVLAWRDTGSVGSCDR